MLIITLFLLGGSMVVVAGTMAVVQSQVRVLTEQMFAKQTYAFADGVAEEVVYRLSNGMNVSASETLIEGKVSADTTATNIVGGKEVRTTATLNGRERTVEVALIQGDGASFSFGVQTDVGGIILENSSSVNGNIYSNGPIEGFNLNLIRGTAVSAGPSGHISEIHATGSAYAHTIEDSLIDDDAYYQNIDIGTVVNGAKYPGSPNFATTSLPINDSLFDAWEAYAASSSVMSAECTAAGGSLVYDSDTTLGPAKIPCDVTFEKFPTITISGVLWIEGNLTFTQGPKFRVDPAIGNKSVPIIVDNPADRITSSQVSMKNSGDWSGNGNRSYVMIVSRNNSAELGGSEKAMVIEQSTGGALLVYAGRGEIELQNTTQLTEITAYRVRLRNSTEVVYDSGLASAVFVTGPGGSYTIDSWKEVE